MKGLSVVAMLLGVAIAGCGGASVKEIPLAAGVNPASLEREDPVWQKAWQKVERMPESTTAVLPEIRRGDPEDRVVALTFDDGPHGAKTLRLLKILREERVKATFFLVGKMAKRYPNIVRAIAKGGHEIGNHTFSHAKLTRLTPEEMRTDYLACSDVLQSITGKRPRYCRPPGGDTDPDVLRAADSLGMTTVLWTTDPGDYAQPGEDVLIERTLGRIKNGGIILLHDGIDQMLDVLPTIIETLRGRGYKIVTAGELTTMKLREMAKSNTRSVGPAS